MMWKMCVCVVENFLAINIHLLHSQKQLLSTLQTDSECTLFFGLNIGVFAPKFTNRCWFTHNTHTHTQTKFCFYIGVKSKHCCVQNIASIICLIVSARKQEHTIRRRTTRMWHLLLSLNALHLFLWLWQTMNIYNIRRVWPEMCVKAHLLDMTIFYVFCVANTKKSTHCQPMNITTHTHNIHINVTRIIRLSQKKCKWCKIHQESSPKKHIPLSDWISSPKNALYFIQFKFSSENIKTACHAT